MNKEENGLFNLAREVECLRVDLEEVNDALCLLWQRMTEEGCQREENFNDNIAIYFVRYCFPEYVSTLNIVRRETERIAGELNRISHQAINREGADV